MFRSVFLRRVTFEKLLCGSVSQLQSQCNSHPTENVFVQTNEIQSACAKEPYMKPSYHRLPVSHPLTHENERKTLLTMCSQMIELDPHVALPIALASKMIALHIVEGKYVEVLHTLTTHPHLEELTKQAILEIQSSYSIVLTPTVILQLLEILTCAEVNYIEQWLVLFAECVAEQKLSLLQQQSSNNEKSNITIRDKEPANATTATEEAESNQEEKQLESKSSKEDRATDAFPQNKENNLNNVQELQHVKALEQCRRKLHDSIMRLVKVQPLSHYPATLLKAICQVSDGTQRADREDVLYVLQMALNASNHHTTNRFSDKYNKNEENTLNKSSSVQAGVFIDPDHFRHVLQLIVEDGKDYRRGAILWKWMRHSSACWDADAVSSAVLAYVNLRDLSEAIECLQTLSEVNVNPTVKAQVALITYLTERTPALPHYADKLIEHWYGVSPRAYYPDSIVDNYTNTNINNNNNQNDNSGGSISNTNVNVNVNEVNEKDIIQSNTLQVNSKIWFGASQEVGQCLIYLHFRLRNHENVLRLLRDAAYALMTQWRQTENIPSVPVCNGELEKENCVEQQHEEQREEALHNIINFVQDTGMAFVFRHFAKDIAFNPLLKECFHDMPVKYALLDNKPFLIGSLIVIEREISAIEERHAREATTQSINANDTNVNAPDKEGKDQNASDDSTSITATIIENSTSKDDSKDLLQEEKEKQQQQETLQTEQNGYHSIESIYKRLANVVIDDIGFAELARFLADEQNSRFLPVERLHLIRNVALHLRCNVPREVQGWMELLESDDASNHDASSSVSGEVK